MDCILVRFDSLAVNLRRQSTCLAICHRCALGVARPGGRNHCNARVACWQPTSKACLSMFACRRRLGATCSRFSAWAARHHKRIAAAPSPPIEYRGSRRFRAAWIGLLMKFDERQPGNCCDRFCGGQLIVNSRRRIWVCDRRLSSIAAAGTGRDCCPPPLDQKNFRRSWRRPSGDWLHALAVGASIGVGHSIVQSLNVAAVAAAAARSGSAFHFRDYSSLQPPSASPRPFPSRSLALASAKQACHCCWLPMARRACFRSHWDCSGP